MADLGADAERPDSHSARRRAVSAMLARIGGVFAAVLLAYAITPLQRRADAGVVLQLVLAVLVLMVVVVWEIRAVILSPFPELRAIETVFVALPLLLVPFAAAYVEESRVSPSSFSEPLNRLDALYFVVTVFATVGFGDITATTTLTRAMVTAQMVVDLILIGFIAKVLFGAAQQRRMALGRPPLADRARRERHTDETRSSPGP